MVTVGMNYEVLEGKESAFERKFELIVAALNATDGHVRTVLYKSVVCPRSYLVLSEWKVREAFEAFIASDAFAKTTSWGTSTILASRPTHEVYEDERKSGLDGQCPMKGQAKPRLAATGT